MSRLRVVPLTRRDAVEACRRWHRHLAPPQGDLFRIGIATGDGELVCVAFAGRPVARALNDGETVEITRVASDGTKNAGSMAYAALTRAAFALGYRRVITYTQEGESGATMRATAGWRIVAERPARKGWSSMSRPRDDAKYPAVARTLWESVAE